MANEFNSLANLWGNPTPRHVGKKRSHRRLEEEHRRLAKFHHERRKSHRELISLKKRKISARRFERKHHAAEKHYEKLHARSLATEKRYDRKHKHIGFGALSKRVAKEYQRKGYSKKAAEKFGKETAGKVYAEQHY